MPSPAAAPAAAAAVPPRAPALRRVMAGLGPAPAAVAPTLVAEADAETPVLRGANLLAASAAAAAASAAATAAAEAEAPLPGVNIGAGSYGVVVSPALPNTVDGVMTEFPENVTKVFFRKSKYEEALKHIEKVPTVMGVNNGHRTHTYKHPYKGSALSSTIRAAHRIKATDPLYLIRMPNLGKDIGHMDAYIPQLRTVPILTIVEQIDKVLSQVYNLQRSNYVHGDIRQLNVMVKPDGTLTIIDFDWLFPKETFFPQFRHNLDFYSVPPEGIFFAATWKGIPMDEPAKSWARQQARYFPNYYAARRMNADAIFNEIARTTLPLTHDEIVRAYRSDVRLAAEPMLFPFFDGFGIAVTLLEFLTKVYGPGLLQHPVTLGGITAFVADLRRLGITNGSTAYTDVQLERSAAALIGIARRSLFPMADLNRERRLIMGSILQFYPIAHETMEALRTEPALAAPLAAPVYAANAAAYGGAGVGPLPNYRRNRHAYSSGRYAGEVPFSGNTYSPSPSTYKPSPRRARKSRRTRRT